MTIEWRPVKLGDTGRWLSGGTPRTTEPAFWNGDIPWISAKSLMEFRVRDSDRRVTSLGAENGTRLVPEGSILMVVRGMSLKSEFRMGITKREVAFGQDCKAILPRHDIVPDYLAYAIKAKTAEILGIVDEAGHGTGRLQMDLLSNVEIPVPTESHQVSIARVLSLHDDKLDSIDRASRLIADALDTMAALTEAELPLVRLGDLAATAHRSVDPSIYGDDLVDHFSLPAFDEGQRPERVPATSIMSNKLRLDDPTILVSRLNPRFDRTWWVTPEVGVPALASPEFLSLTASNSSELARIWLAVRGPAFRTEVRSRVTGTSGSHQRIRPDDMLSIPVPDVRKLPDGLALRASRLLAAREQRRHEADAVIQMRDFLLEELFCGDLTVPPMAVTA